MDQFDVYKPRVGGGDIRYSIFAAIFVAMLAFAGCAPRHDQINADSKRQSNESELTATAEASAKEYCGRVSAALRDHSSRAAEFKSVADLFDSSTVAMKAAREESFAPFEDAMTARLKPGEKTPYDPIAVRQAFAEAADGFSRAVGGSGQKGKK